MSNTGFGVLGLDYRGYGNSEGSPSEEGFYQDGRATMDYAINQLSVPENKIIIYGESIGTGVATQIAKEYKTAALILQSPFSSLIEPASYRYPWLPVNLLIMDRYDSLSKIADIHAPLLVFHGEKDTIVPISAGKRLFPPLMNQKKPSIFLIPAIIILTLMN